MRDGKTVRVDKDSIDYRLGQISSRLDNQNGQIHSLAESVDRMTCVVSGNTTRIDAFDKKLTNFQENDLWENRNRTTFRQKMLCGLVGAAITGSATTLGILWPF